MTETSTGTNVTDEMVETAARAMWERIDREESWTEICHAPAYRRDARAALEAVAPLIAGSGRAEMTADLHWSNAAAAEYPGDEYEQYPLRTAFGRGVKWERKRAARKANEQ